jgi:hypothetical protein
VLGEVLERHQPVVRLFGQLEHSISDFLGPGSVYDRFCRDFKPRSDSFRSPVDEIFLEAQRFNKNSFQIVEKTATILRKEDLN